MIFSPSIFGGYPLVFRNTQNYLELCFFFFKSDFFFTIPEKDFGSTLVKYWLMKNHDLLEKFQLNEADLGQNFEVHLWC